LHAKDITLSEYEVTDVILTHLHCDHVGTFDDFPKARFHLQDAEMSFATGRHMCNGHYYEHMRSNRFFTLVFKLGDMLNGYRTLNELAASPDHVVPGHDPLVMQYYPAPSPELDGIVVRLDVAPKT
jgi:glyoxylase-like metal-dependent hydrolase (beta-lactamase superfamily II)